MRCRCGSRPLARAAQWAPRSACQSAHDCVLAVNATHRNHHPEKRHEAFQGRWTGAHDGVPGVKNRHLTRSVHHSDAARESRVPLRVSCAVGTVAARHNSPKRIRPYAEIAVLWGIMSENPNRDFDVAVTFAGEEREFVEEVVRLVKADGFTVFYDEDAKADLWGEDLTEFFADVYERRSRYAVMFISAAYAAKPWTRLERRSVLTRAMQAESPYLLPVRFDSTQLPGVRSTIGHLEALKEGPAGVAAAIAGKLQNPKSNGARMFNGRVPRTDAEVAILLGERPGGWEYLLLGYWLATGIDENQSKYSDHLMRFAVAGEHVADDLALDRSSAELARLMTTIQVFEDLLDQRSQELALGAPGEAGDPDLIRHLANRMTSIYVQLLDWSYRVRAIASSGEEGRAMFRALSRYADQPIEAIRRFVEQFRIELDELSGLLERGETPRITLEIKFEIPESVTSEHHDAMRAFGDMRRRESN